MSKATVAFTREEIRAALAVICHVRNNKEASTASEYEGLSPKKKRLWNKACNNLLDSAFQLLPASDAADDYSLCAKCSAIVFNDEPRAYFLDGDLCRKCAPTNQEVRELLLTAAKDVGPDDAEPFTTNEEKDRQLSNNIKAGFAFAVIADREQKAAAK